MNVQSQTVQTGNSLIEVTVVSTLLVVVLIGIGAAVGIVSNSSHEVVSQARLDSKLGMTMERLAGFIRGASDASVRVTAGGGMEAATNPKALTWVGPVAAMHYDGIQSEEGSVVFVMDSTETDNGKDDDNDGLVDEGTLYRSNSDSKPAAIARNVELFDIECLDRAVQIRMVLAASDPAERQRVRRMRVVQTFELRN